MPRHTDTPMDSLIEKLTGYQKAPISELKKLQPTIVLLAEEVLIDEEGQPNREAISLLRKNGFDACATKIRQGSWEGGQIETRNGYISFG